MPTEIQTRIQLKIDTPENWAKVEDTFIPLAGERTIYLIGNNSLSKTGDGSTILKNLNWDSGIAYDVPSWAKSESLKYTDLPEQLLTEMSEKVSSATISTIISLTEAEYSALTNYSDTTLYIIKES